MKTRTGFVSNSSTTSFCIYGVCVNKEELNLSEDVSKEIDNGSFYEFLEEEFNKNNISFYISHGPDYSDSGIYIGRSWDNIEDDETGRDFKLSIKNDFLKVFPNYKGDFSTHEEAWRDG